ncbi:MAG TPA: hypothetical protein VFN37_12560 [Candidatus Baltobacteraceae bacterium]|nr:hypothetical protein [Candidatus Baltobacteraceae bacterium]
MMLAPAGAASLDSRDAAYLKTAMQIQPGRYALATYEAKHGTGAVKKFAGTLASRAAHDYSQIQGLHGSALDQRFVRELRISDDINQDTEKQEMRNGQSGTLKAFAKRRYAVVGSELKTLKRF